MAGDWEDVKKFAGWAYDKARSHPIGQIEDTLRTGKAPQKREDTPPENPQRATPGARKFRRYGPKQLSKGRR